MQNKIITQSLSTLRIIFISSLTIFTIYSVQAWTQPSSTPPNGNVSGPITTSATAQTKIGDICTLAGGGKCLSTVSGIVGPQGPQGPAGSGGLSGSGFSNYIPVWNGASSLTYSSLFDYGAAKGIYENGDICYTFTNGGTNYCLGKPNGGLSSTGITASPMPGFVTSVTAGTGITVSPASPATGAVTVSAVSGGLGVGQTWQNMTGSAVGCNSSSQVRASGVICTNTTGKPIMINVTGTVVINGYVTLKVDTVEVGRISANMGGGAVNVNLYAPISAVIPDGSTYTVTISAGTIYKWVELR